MVRGMGQGEVRARSVHAQKEARDQIGADVAGVKLGVPREALLLCRRKVCTVVDDETGAWRQTLRAVQIGRASCRERVWTVV